MASSNFRRKVLDYLRRFGHATPVESYANPGVPDINYCISGTEGWIELKQGRDVLRPSQKLWMGDRIRNGGTVWVLYKGVGACHLLPHGKAFECRLPDDFIREGIEIEKSLEGLEKWILNRESE